MGRKRWRQVANRGLILAMAVAVMLFVSWPLVSYAGNFGNGQNAVIVLGQANFTSNSANRSGAVAANTLYDPTGIVLDSSGNLWVADYSNNRVLKYAGPFSNGMSATLVLGQANFTSNSANRGGAVADNTLQNPYSLAFDSSGNLWVADFYNSRVLKYSTPFSDGMSASLVLGQANFTSNSANPGGVAANTFNYPTGLAFDSSSGNLWVADYSNHRVLRFDTPFSNGMSASLVLGQANFTSNSANPGGVAAGTLNSPVAVTVDSSANLWTADLGNHRGLKYNTPFSNGMSASVVLGQSNFTSNSANRGTSVAANTLNVPVGLVSAPSGDLWVVDRENNRALKYGTPLSNGMSASAELGQADFTSGSANRGGSVTANTLYRSTGIM